MSEEEEENVEFDSCGDPGSDVSDDEFDSAGDPDSEDVEFDSDGGDDILEEEDEGEIMGEGNEDEGIEFDGDFVTEPVETLSKVEKEKEYEVIHESKLYSSIRKEVKELQKILSIDFFSAKEILKSYRWNREKALSEYCSIGRDDMFSKTGLDCFLIFGQPEETEEFECPICLDDLPSSRKITISKCKHFLCGSCMNDFFKTIESERISGMSKTIECPLQGCKCTFHSGIVAHILKTKKNMLRKEIIRNYVMENKLVKYCPRRNCGIYVSKLRSGDVLGSSILIECECGLSYCFHCGHPEYHTPASCDHLKDWAKQISEESATMQWMDLNSRPCPACKVSIVKNGGCNMMRCGSCGCRFCWMCMRGGVSYGHTCVFKPASEAENMKQKIQQHMKKVKMLDSTNYFSSIKKWTTIRDSRKKEEKNILNFSNFDTHPLHEKLHHSSVVLVKARLVMMNCIIYFFYEFNREMYKIQLIHETCEKELRRRKVILDQTSSIEPKKRLNVVSKKKREKERRRKEKMKKKSKKTKKILEKLERMRDLRKKIETNRNLFICFLEQLEENTERLSHYLSKNVHKMSEKILLKIYTVTNILEGLFETVEREMHIFEKDRELEKDVMIIRHSMEKEEKKKKKV